MQRWSALHRQEGPGSQHHVLQRAEPCSRPLPAAVRGGGGDLRDAPPYVLFIYLFYLSSFLLFSIMGFNFS